MKKTLFIILASMMVVAVTACGKKDDNENNILGVDVDTNYMQDDNNLEDLIWKTSLTLKDLDRIDEYRFPKSYSYVTYKWNAWNSTVETWDYIYLKDVNNKLLLPIYENMADREVINSSIEDGVIITMVDITLNNGESYSVKYMNNPETLEYVQATFNAPTSMTMYKFNY